VTLGAVRAVVSVRITESLAIRKGVVLDRGTFIKLGYVRAEVKATPPSPLGAPEAKIEVIVSGRQSVDEVSWKEFVREVNTAIEREKQRGY